MDFLGVCREKILRKCVDSLSFGRNFSTINLLDKVKWQDHFELIQICYLHFPPLQTGDFLQNDAIIIKLLSLKTFQNDCG